MTASSPWTDGMIETRKSIVRPLTRSLKRPSWGTRFSAMSSSDMTLMRLMIVSWCRLSMRLHGRVEHAVDAVLDEHLACRAVSMWMSEARRWMALNMVESTSLMIGDWCRP